MRTYKQILEKAKIMSDRLMSPHIVSIDEQMTGSDIFVFLKFKDATELKGVKTFTKEEWEKIKENPTEEYVKTQLANYLSFAFRKATNKRGISASRSITHYQNWLWLLEDHELLAYAENDDNYGRGMGYGLDILRKIRDKYKDFITVNKEEFIKEYGDY